MTVAEVKSMSLLEKLQLMEAIWLDLREHVDGCAIPAEHKSLLDERRRRVASGESSLRSWDEVKNSLGRK